MAGRRAAPQVLRERVGSGLAELVADRDAARAFTLLIDGTPQSHVHLDDPGELRFEYIRRLARLVDLARPPRQPLRALHLGGGGLSLARYVAATRPRSTQQAVEVDGALVELVRRELPLDRNWRLKIRTGDAREQLVRSPPGRFDLVVSDVFAGARTPAHLTSVEFVAAAAAALDVGGWYAVNIADGGALAFTKAQVATVRAVFGHACLIADPPVLRGRRFGNLILLAAHAELPVTAIATAMTADPAPGRVQHGPELDRFTGGAHPVTDATAQASPLPPDELFGRRPADGDFA
ncbi:spermidine synthase [Pseudonocardia sp. GCM10023141]|uniref:spermidine synthase n=1 Tax=Pseudonocardia sp. GCM10023141 TaxID=3252653 RepID=UPI003620A886